MRAARNPPPRLTNMDFCEFRALWIPAFAGMTTKIGGAAMTHLSLMSGALATNH